MDVQTKHRAFRLQFIEACLRNNLKNYTKPAIFEQLNIALSEQFGDDKTISERTFNEDWKLIKTALEDNGLQLNSWKEGKNWLYRYSDTEFTINDTALSKKEIKRLSDAIRLLQQIKGIDSSHELTDILQKLDAQVKYHSHKSTAAIGFQQMEAAKGYAYVDDLYDAIIEKTVVDIAYQPYGKDMIVKTVSPYHLRQYNNRWFLFGWDEALQSLANFPLDRMVKAPKPTHALYHEPTGIFDAATYFDAIIGVTRFADNPIETIVLRVTEQRAPYLITKPLHPTQAHQLLADGNYEFTLQLSINNELTQLLLGFGSAIQVLAPASLRLFMQEEASKMVKCYNLIQ